MGRPGKLSTLHSLTGTVPSRENSSRCLSFALRDTGEGKRRTRLGGGRGKLWQEVISHIAFLDVLEGDGSSQRTDWDPSERTDRDDVPLMTKKRYFLKREGYNNKTSKKKKKRGRRQEAGGVGAHG